MKRNFIQMLENIWAKGSAVCVGLDSEITKLPKHIKGSQAERMLQFNKDIVDATHDLVCAFKLQIAYYEAAGTDGITAMIETVSYIKKRAPDVPIIVDAKRADIGNTNDAYARAIFDIYGFDAVTLHPYLGIGALKPFLDRKEKGCIILCRTSNPQAREFQDLIVKQDNHALPLWQYVANQVVKIWNTNGNCCMVAGATYPQELKTIRTIAGDMPLLIPGVGSQGGDIEQTVKAGKDSRGQGMIINSSRDIIFASGGKDFAKKARSRAVWLRDTINMYI